tara:strand:+ start:201 stop:494 length:294 start_codon:yes stop_codon:yes gene_type:complete
MGKKSKKTQVPTSKKLKNMADRIQSVTVAKEKLNSIGLSPEIEGIKAFYEICDEYINSGINKTGSIKLYGFKRILEYILPENYHTDVSVLLKYDKSV